MNRVSDCVHAWRAGGQSVALLAVQEVAIKELLSSRGGVMRKATSVPNIHNVCQLTPL